MDEENLEEVMEEESYEDEEYASLLPYVLFVRANIKWPNEHNNKVEYEVCVPIGLQEKGDGYNIPFLNEEIEFRGVDRINDVVQLATNFGKREEHTIFVGRPVKVPFKFYRGRRADGEPLELEGVIEFELRIFNFLPDRIDGSIFLKETLVDLDLGKEKESVSAGLDGIDLASDESLFGGVSENGYMPVLIDEEAKFVIVMGYRGDDFGNEVVTFIPLYKGKEAIYKSTMFYHVINHMVEKTYILKFDEEI